MCIIFLRTSSAKRLSVMANVLCHISGSKRLLLFPPSDIQFLGFAPGASSSSLDVFKELDDNNLGRASPHEALLLNPGDILFIPPLWIHAVQNSVSIAKGVSIAVNVVSSPPQSFFQDLEWLISITCSFSRACIMDMPQVEMFTATETCRHMRKVDRMSQGLVRHLTACHLNSSISTKFG